MARVHLGGVDGVQASLYILELVCQAWTARIGIDFGGTACLWDPHGDFGRRANMFGKQKEDSSGGNL